MKRSEEAYKAWQAAVGLAKTKATELDTKGEAVTADDQAALDQLLNKATDCKTARSYWISGVSKRRRRS